MAKRSLIIPFINLAHGLDHFFMLIFPTAVLALENEWGGSYGETIALGTITFIALAIATLPAGWLGDRMNRMTMIAVFFVGIGIASILTGFADGPIEMAMGLGLIGLFAAIYHPVGTAIVVQNTTSVGRSLGINGVCGNLGVAFAGGITALLIDAYGWRYAFIVPGAVSVILGVVFWITVGRSYTDTPANHVSQNRAEPASLPTVGDPKPVLTQATKIRLLCVIVVTSLCGGVVFHALTNVVPKLYEERLGDMVTSISDVGGLVTAVFAIGALGQFVVGRLLDRHYVKPIFLLVYGLQIPMFLLAYDAYGPRLFIITVPMMMLVFGEIPLVDFIIGRYGSAAWHSRMYALRHMLALGVGASAIPIVAYLHHLTGGFAAMFIVFAILVGAIVLMALLMPERRDLEIMKPEIAPA